MRKPHPAHEPRLTARCAAPPQPAQARDGLACQRSTVRLVAVDSRRTPSGTNRVTTGGCQTPATVTREDTPSGEPADTIAASEPSAPRNVDACSATAASVSRAVGSPPTVVKTNPSAV